MEIERKWLVSEWPAGLPVLYEQNMRQGYLVVNPTVRIREEQKTGEESHYILCFKSPGTLARKEIEMEISKEKFEEIKDLIGLPLIPKTRRTYLLPDGLKLEVNEVDRGLETEYMYAEIEYADEEQARTWEAPDPELRDYLSREVTEVPGQTMGAYWIRTRLMPKRS